MNRMVLVLLVSTAITTIPSTACSESGGEGEEMVSREMTREKRIEERKRLQERLPRGAAPDKVPHEPDDRAAVTGEVPEEMLDAIMAELSRKYGVPTESVEVVRAESKVWNDGSLGCPQPGVMYTQALVDGYHIVLRHGEQEYDYRASARGYFFLCSGPGL